MYPQRIARGGLQDICWSSPVLLETCGTPGSWKNMKYELKRILDQALGWHASTINEKATKIPDESKKDFEEFQKQIGYRYMLRR